MNQGKRHLMFLKKDDSGIVVEAINITNWKSIKQEAEAKRMTCQPLSIENFYPDYRGYRYFDLRNSMTLEAFSINYILHTWETDKKIKRSTKALKSGLSIEQPLTEHNNLTLFTPLSNHD